MDGAKEYPDIRVARTRRRLKEALLGLMEHKRIHDLKVKEVAERAGVNRVTFYDHYDSLEALLWELVDDKMREYERIIEVIEPPADSLSEVQTQQFRKVVQTIEHIRNNSAFYRVMLLGNGDHRVAEIVHERLSQSLLKAMSRLDPPPAGIDLIVYAHWTIGGAISLFKLWLRNDRTMSDLFMIDQLRKVTAASARVLEEG